MGLNLGRRAVRTWRSAVALTRLQWWGQRTYRFSVLAEMLGMSTSLLSLYFLSGLVEKGTFSAYEGAYLGFAVVGQILQVFLAATANAPATWLRRAQVEGTLDTLVSTHTPLLHILLAAVLYPLGKAVGRVLIYLAVCGLILGWPLTAGGVALGVAALLATASAYASLGLTGAAFTLAYRRPPPMTGLVVSVSMLLSGVMYPVSVLPGPLQTVANVFPLTHVLRAVRGALLTSSPVAGVLPSLSVLVLLGALGLPCALVFFRLAVGRCLKEGSLGQM